MPATALDTDLYQLTMIAGYVSAGIQDQRASFELFVRRLPPNRAYLIAAGLETAIDYILGVKFNGDDLAWLRTLPSLTRTSPRFFDYLERFRFSGDVRAMREGTPFFPNEPVLRVTAPLGEAQLLETALLAIVNHQSSIASKAARIVAAAGGRTVMEFGGRRAHGAEAARYSARAAYLAGCDSTSFVEAGREFGIPLSGTMAHSWVQASASELEAFTRFMETYGPSSTLLLDTYDTAAAAKMIVSAGLRPAAVRIDSGDLLALSRQVRAIFDAGGLDETKILVSGELDEYRIRDLVAESAPIDGFGVGTALSTSEDAPALGGVYKMVQVQHGSRLRDVIKRSAGKATWPGLKQVHRMTSSGIATRDVIALDGEAGDGRPLLEPVIEHGRRMGAAAPIAVLRSRAMALIAELPPSLRALDSTTARYDVSLSPGLTDLLPRG